jgi:arginine decarboxylase
MSLEINVTWGCGRGPTCLAAFDAALCDAGIADLNLVTISSIIPAGSGIVVGRLHPEELRYGDLAYVVLAQASSCAQDEAWAGLGWLVDPESGRGVFVEHTEDSEEKVLGLISESAEAMRVYRPYLQGNLSTQTVGVRRRPGAGEEAIAAVVAAVYECSSWRESRGQET